MTNVFEGSDGEVAALVETPMGHDPNPPAEELTEEDWRNAAVLDAAFRRWAAQGPVNIQLPGRKEAYLLMALLQLTTRHPDQPFSELAESIGRQLQDAVCDTADIYALAEAGWRRERDR